MNSGRQKAPRNLAEPLQPLVELANLRDDAGDFERFIGRWPLYLLEMPSDLIEEDPPAFLTAVYGANKLGHPSKQAPLTEEEERAMLAEIRADLETWKKNPATLATPEAPNPATVMDVYRRRQALRKIWRGDTQMLAAFLFPLDIASPFIEDSAEGRFIGFGHWELPIVFDWHRGRFGYVPRTPLQKGVYELFKRAPFVRVCANPDCAVTPYFIAAKATQRYCSNECAQMFQKEWKRRWWSEHGEKWRRNKSKRKKKAKR